MVQHVEQLGANFIRVMIHYLPLISKRIENSVLKSMAFGKQQALISFISTYCPFTGHDSVLLVCCV